MQKLWSQFNDNATVVLKEIIPRWWSPLYLASSPTMYFEESFKRSRDVPCIALELSNTVVREIAEFALAPELDYIQKSLLTEKHSSF